MNFLLEIGTEEIPHWMIPGALKQLAAMNLFGAAVAVDATPRRLVVRASGFPERTPDEEQIIKGPPISAGDKAAAGFAKKQGVELSAMTKVGDYYELRKLVPGPRRARHSCRNAAGRRSSASSGPKPCTGRAAKPARGSFDPSAGSWRCWMTKSSRSNWPALRAATSREAIAFWARAPIPVTFATYESELRKNFVILSADERRQKIVTEITALGAKPDADLVETLTFITEYPTRDPWRLRPGFSGTARRSADHSDAAPPKVFLCRVRARQARAALCCGDEYQRRSRGLGEARQ